MDNFKPSSEIKDADCTQSFCRPYSKFLVLAIIAAYIKKTHSSFELSTASFCTTQIWVWVFPTKVIWESRTQRIGELRILDSGLSVLPTDNSISPVIFFGSNFSIVLPLIAQPALGVFQQQTG